jgi:hypothetical protein
VETQASTWISPRKEKGGSRPFLELQDRDTQLLGLVGEVLLDAVAREDEDAHGEHVQNGVVALEGCGLGVPGPVGLEGDLGDASAHLAAISSAPLALPPCRRTMSGCLVRT